MTFYVQIKTIQETISSIRGETGKDAPFYSVIKKIYEDHAYQTEAPNPPVLAKFLHLNDDSFTSAVAELFYAFSSEDFFSDTDYDLIAQEDTTAISLFYGTEHTPYTYSCFEIAYVYRGTCEMTFLKETRLLKQGDFCIVTPGALHEFHLMSADSFMCPILVKPETFRQTFFSLLSRQDILSRFFHQVLSTRDEPNYLLFHTDRSDQVNLLMREIFLEHFQYDMYTNRNAVCWLNLIFTYVLRNYQTYSQFSNYQNGPDYIPIFRYIQARYHTVTLSELSVKFNYSVPYLSKLIREFSGENFSQLVTRLRMEEAVKLLCETDDTIDTIAQKTGFNSADHFTRTYKKYYQATPSSYRRAHKLL